MSNEEINEQYLPSFEKGQIEKFKRQEKNRKRWRKEMEANTAMQQYFEQFTPNSVTRFYDNYFTYKNIFAEYGDLYNQMMEDDSIKWIGLASKYLEIIQQKNGSH